MTGEVCPICGKLKKPPLFSRRTGAIGKNWPSRKHRNSPYCWHYLGPRTKRRLIAASIPPGPTQHPRRDKRGPSKPR